MKRVKKWVKEHKGLLIKIGIGTGIAAVSAYLGYKYALSLEDVIDMRDEKQAEFVDRVVTGAQELGSIAQVNFIRNHVPEAEDMVEKFLAVHPEVNDPYPAITYDLAKGMVTCVFDEDATVGKF